MHNDGIESLHSDWQPLERIVRLLLLLELGGDPALQLSKEVNSRFIDRSQCLYTAIGWNENEAGRSEYLTSFLEAAASAAAAAVTEEAGT